MNISIIGAGNVGGALAGLWTGAGYAVRVARRPDIAQATADADVLALCVPWPAAQGALASCGTLAGKIIIDCTNPLAPALEGLTLGGTTSAAEQIQDWHPQARVVKAFNSIGAALLGPEKLEGQTVDGFYCGDDASKQAVRPLVVAAGLRPVDVGPLRNARYLEALAMLWIDLAVNQKRGPTFAFSLVGGNAWRSM